VHNAKPYTLEFRNHLAHYKLRHQTAKNMREREREREREHTVSIRLMDCKEPNADDASALW
jgi:hypothetical protein